MYIFAYPNTSLIITLILLKSVVNTPVVFVGQVNAGAVHILFKHSPYRQFVPVVHVEPIAPVRPIMGEVEL